VPAPAPNSPPHLPRKEAAAGAGAGGGGGDGGVEGVVEGDVGEGDTALVLQRERETGVRREGRMNIR
jgi:hypothetical protein